MAHKQILVREELHQQVKAEAALKGLSIIEFTNCALRRYLKDGAPSPVIAGLVAAWLAGVISAEEAMQAIAGQAEVAAHVLEVGA